MTNMPKTLELFAPKYSEKQKQGVMEMLSATNQTEFTGISDWRSI